MFCSVCCLLAIVVIYVVSFVLTKYSYRTQCLWYCRHSPLFVLCFICVCYYIYCYLLYRYNSSYLWYYCYYCVLIYVILIMLPLSLLLCGTLVLPALVVCFKPQYLWYLNSLCQSSFCCVRSVTDQIICDIMSFF